MATAILVVDDSEHLCNAFRWILQDDGYTVHVATGGRAALSCLGEMAPPGLILVDRGLPDMTGLEVIEAIKQNPALREVPIVLMSGSAITEDVGDVPMLLKPVDTVELLTIAHRYAGRA